MDRTLYSKPLYVRQKVVLWDPGWDLKTWDHLLLRYRLDPDGPGLVSVFLSLGGLT